MKTHSKRFHSILALTGGMLIFSQAARAATYYWDIDGATAGAGSATPSGAWTSAGTTWSTDSLGAIATSAVTTGLTDDLFFSAGTNATGNYTITLTTTQNAKSLTFEEGGTITISGAGGIINLGGTGNINVVTGRTATIGSTTTNTKIAGSAGLTKLGAGTLNVLGTEVNTFTGGLNLNGGTLALSFANFASGWTDIINSGNALSFSGGLLTIAGENSANNTTQSFAGVTVNAGGGSLLVNPNGAGVSNGTTVNLNSLGTLSSWAAGSSLVLGKALSAGTGTVTITTTTDKDATGIYGGRVVFADGTASTGYNWATSTGSGTFTLGAYSGYNTTLPTNTGSSTTNYSITAGITLDGNLAANTLKITGSATALDLGANTLTIKSGGLLSVGTTAQTISGTAGATRLTAGSGNGGSEDLVIHQYNTAANAGLVITAVIGDNTAGSGNIVNLVKAGTGTLALQGLNTFTGNTFINAGTLVLGSPTNSSLVGSLGNGSYAGNISIASGAQLAVRSSSNQTLSGAISGDGTLFKGGNGTLTLSGDNTYTGTTGVGPLSASVGGGTLIVSSFNSVGAGAGYARRVSSSLGAPTTVANGTITIGAGTSSSGTILKYIGSGETTDRNLSFNFNDDLGHTLDSSGTGLLKFVGTVTGSGSNASPAVTLTGTGSGEIAGNIANFTGVANMRIAKSGTGNWTLSGTNSYTGATQVNVGLLNVTGTLTSAVTVANNAFLSGTGTTTGTLSLSTGSTIVGTTAGSSFKAETVTATGVAGVKIAGSDGSGTIGTHTIGLVRYNTGTGPDTANFTTAGYHSGASVSNVGGAGGETQLTYINEARTWNSASGTWDAMTANTWQEGDFKFGHGDAVTFNDTGTGGGSARAVTLNSLITPGSVTFNNSTSTPYTVSGTGTIAGLSGLTKSGNGTVTLSTTNTYTGATTVTGGILAVNGSLANTTTTVQTGGTLRGSGTIGGSVTIQSGGTIAAGNSIESLATGNLTLASAAIFAYEMNNDATATAAGDLTAVAGNLTLDLTNASILTLSELGSGSWTVGEKLTLLSYTGTWNGGLFNYGGTLADDSTISFSGANWTFNYNDTVAGTNYTGDLTGANYITMTAVVIPEPKAALLGCLGVLLLLRRRR